MLELGYRIILYFRAKLYLALSKLVRIDHSVYKKCGVLELDTARRISGDLIGFYGCHVRR
jgi:hypothetical protein